MSRYNSKKIDNVKVMLKAGADGVGIQSIEKTGTQGIVDTYTITFTNGTKTTIQITNGNGIESITKTSTQGKVDTYTITFTDGTTTTFQVTNGADTNASIAEKVTNPATRTYRLGEYVVFDDTLCEVSEEIEAGDTFEIGTNLDDTTVMAEVKMRSSQIFNTVGYVRKNIFSPYRFNLALENVTTTETGEISYGYGYRTAFIAKVEPYTDYIVSCSESVAMNRMILGLTDEFPEEDGTFYCAVNESIDRTASFNSGNHTWAIFYMQVGVAGIPLSQLTPMLRLATELDDTYEAPQKSVADYLDDLGQSQEDLIENTVGFVSKNLLPLNINTLKELNGSDSYWTWSGNEASTDGITLTFTVNDDDMVTAIRLVRTGIYEQGYRSFKLIDNLSDYLVNGEEYILSGSEGGSYSTYGIYNGTRGTWESYEGESEPTPYRNTWDTLLIDIAPVLIDETYLYPMVRNASVNSRDFVPYHKPLGTASTKNSTSVVTDSTDLVESGAVYTALQSKMSYADNGVLGAKNFWENNILRNTSPKTVAGVTGTLNANETITITGHNTGTTNNVIECGEIDLKAGNYILSGNPANYEKARPQIYIDNSHVYHNLGGDTPFTVESDATNVKLRLYFTTAFTSDDTIVFKPMIRLADDTDSTYQPHAETNRELTVNKADNSVIGTVEDGTNPTKSYAVGEHMIRGGKFCTVTSPVTTSSTWTLGGNYVEGTIADNLVKQDTFSGNTSANGTLSPLYNGVDRAILGVKPDTSAVIVLPYRSGDGTTTNALVLSTNAEPVRAIAVSGRYYYI